GRAGGIQNDGRIFGRQFSGHELAGPSRKHFVEGEGFGRGPVEHNNEDVQRGSSSPGRFQVGTVREQTPTAAIGKQLFHLSSGESRVEGNGHASSCNDAQVRSYPTRAVGGQNRGPGAFRHTRFVKQAS